jgi:microcystin degradation protein MlrC
LLAGLFHETNTFLGGLSTLETFEVRRGDELLASEGDVSPMAGVLEVARRKAWEVLPAADLRAMPGATVSDGVVELFWREVHATVEGEVERGLDGVFLVLHGAMVSESYDDVEGEILRRLRGLEGLSGVPVCGVLDLHANFTDAMATHSDGLISYRENPHTDAMEAAEDAALLLDRLMRSGERPVTVWDHPPLMWPPSGTGTAEDPMLTLERAARKLEAEHPEILAVNVLAGFPFADVSESGVAFSAVTVGDADEAQDALRKLGELAWSLREVGVRPGLSLREAMRRLGEHEEGPVLLVEPSDNIGAGAPGDSTHLLRAFVEGGTKGAGVIINDPETVRSLRDAKQGERCTVRIGGKSGATGAEPLTLTVELVSTSGGRFELEDDRSHLASMVGARVDMGPCAVVRHGGVTVLLTSRKTPPFDLGQWRSQGIDPERLFAIGVKAAAAHRRTYGPIAKASYAVDLPGPCAENLKRLLYKRVQRPVYPLDEDF